jgi:hypothetical protein
MRKEEVFDVGNVVGRKTRWRAASAPQNRLHTYEKGVTMAQVGGLVRRYKQGLNTPNPRKGIETTCAAAWRSAR